MFTSVWRHGQHVHRVRREQPRLDRRRQDGARAGRLRGLPQQLPVPGRLTHTYWLRGYENVTNVQLHKFFLCPLASYFLIQC